MRILITGGAGYKGSLLTRALLQADHQVTIYDHFSSGYNAILNLTGNKKFQVIKKDIRDISAVDVKHQDVIFHLAAISGLPACRQNPSLARSINLEATNKLVKLLSKNQLIVFASTTSIYGISREVCTESSPVTPISLYGETKIKAEKVILNHPNSVVFRFATLFGVSPSMRTDLLVNNFVYRTLSEKSLVLFDADNSRTFLHVNDAISAYLLVFAHRKKMSGNIFNVGSNNLNFSKLKLARMIKQYIPNLQIYQSQITDTDQRDFIISYDKISQLGYQPRVSIQTGIKELIKLYSFYSPKNEGYA